MEKKPKDKRSKEPAKPKSAEKISSRSNNQKFGQYYYDDAHGYEIYRPEDDEDMTDDFFSETKPPKINEIFYES